MIISICGFPGSGKSTVSKILEKKLGFERIYMGQLLRDKAKDMGITIEELLEIANHDGGKIDKEIDDMVLHYAKTKDNFIIESRTAWHFIPNAKKVFIDVSVEESARRISKDRVINSDRNELHADNLEEVKTQILERVANESQRYKKYYDIDPYDKSNFDFVIDSTNLSPEEVANEIIRKIKE